MSLQHVSTKFELINEIDINDRKYTLSKAVNDDVYQIIEYQYTLPLKDGYSIRNIWYTTYEKCKREYDFIVNGRI